MNGILSNNSKDKKYQKKFEKALEKATNLSENTLYSSYNFKKNDHFKYLKAKRENKVISLKKLNLFFNNM